MRANIILNTPYMEFDLEDCGFDEDTNWSDLSEDEKDGIKDCLYAQFCDDLGFSINIEED